MVALVDLSHADLNTLALIAGLFMVFVFGPRFFKQKAARLREDQSEATIKIYKERVEAMALELTSLREDVQACRSEAARWEARYHETAKYAAPEALKSVSIELERTRTAIVTAVESLGELVMKNTELVARQASAD